MTDTSIPDTKRKGNPAGLEKGRQILANKRAAERERIFAQSGDHVAPPRPVSEFEGMTATDCCDDCNERNCIISGQPYCGHPMKSGLQAREKNNHDALKRFKRAKEALKDAKLDLERMSE
jgi:hypothetical protein